MAFARAAAARRLARLALALVRRALARLFLLPAPHLLFLLDPLLFGGAQPRLLLEVVALGELVQIVEQRVGRRLLRVDEQRLVVRRIRVLHFAQLLRHVAGALIALLGPFRCARSTRSSPSGSSRPSAAGGAAVRRAGAAVHTLKCRPAARRASGR